METRYRHMRNGLALAALVFTAQLQAATLTDTFTVTATVNASCSMTAGDINFGSWDPLGGDAFSTGTISVSCSSNLPYAVAIDSGSYFTGNCITPGRQMSDGTGNYISYGLYQDAGHTQQWGCDITNDYEESGNGGAQALTVRARIPAAQGVTSGVYSDNLVATITF